MKRRARWAGREGERIAETHLFAADIHRQQGGGTWNRYLEDRPGPITARVLFVGAARAGLL